MLRAMRARLLAAAATTVAIIAFVTVARAKPDKKDLDQLLADTDAIAKSVSAIRGLPIKKDIARGVMSRPQIEERVKQRIDEDYGAAELATEALAAKKLGLLPADADYKGMVLALLTEQIAGFYDPVVKELYIADWIDVPEQRIVMAHEICHALQDQSFDLVKFTKPIKDNNDAQLARQALVEGDGTALMIEFMFKDMKVKVDPWADDTLVNQMSKMGSVPQMEQFNKAPVFLKDELMFPYIEGLRLLAATRRSNPWSRVDEMFKKPPESTEQVMHPEKYFAGEKPIAVKAPATMASLKKWKLVYQNVLGELGFRSWLKTHKVADDRAADAAAGWGGDRYALYAPPGDEGKDPATTVMVIMSTWDEDADAAEAFAAGHEAVADLAGGGEPASESKDAFASWSVGETRTWIERKGKKVAIVLGAPKDQADKLRKDVWASWK
jgi:hypothetical protein